MLSTDHAQTGELGHQSRSISNRLMPPPTFSRVGALDPASSRVGFWQPEHLRWPRMGFSGGTGIGAGLFDQQNLANHSTRTLFIEM